MKTATQIRKEVKTWLANNGYANLIGLKVINGIYHFDNCGNYMLDGKTILELATGLQAEYMGISMAKIKA